MSKFDEINSPRVADILAKIEMIEKSARSNNADAAEILRPVLIRIAGLVGARDMPNRPAIPAPAAATLPLSQATAGASIPAPRASLPMPRETLQKPAWVTIREAAENATLSDLMVALAVYMNRVDEALSERKL